MQTLTVDDIVDNSSADSELLDGADAKALAHSSTLAALEESQTHLTEVIGLAAIVLHALDKNGVFTLSEGRGLESLGLKPGQLVGSSLYDVYKDVPQVLAHAEKALAGEFTTEIIHVEDIVFESRYVPQLNEAGEVERVVGVSLDITEQYNAKRVVEEAHAQLELRVKTRTAELARANEQLAYQAFHDNLTGLPNRALFRDRLEHALKRAERPASPGFSVMFLDLDDFKVVNDSLGHAAGDELLCQVGTVLSEFLRPGDTVARLGGDEFAILLENITATSALAQVVNRLFDGLSSICLNEVDLNVKASVGVVSNPQSDATVEDVIRDADIAMYRAKGQGKNRYTLFDPKMRSEAQARLTLESELRRALTQNELKVYYQPIVETASGRLTGFEALVRWLHPVRGLVSPADFIPVAEETGLIIELDRFVLAAACQQMKDWQQQFGHDLSLSVNLSSGQFSHSDLPGFIKSVLSTTNFAAQHLHLELTESVLVACSPRVTNVLQDLRDLGVELHLDDFGTGYSSLNYLQRFSAHTLKIDRSFIFKLFESEESATLIRTMVLMGNALGMQVTAEGVETPEQLEYLKGLGCNFVQGYLYSKPIPEAEVAELVRRLT